MGGALSSDPAGFRTNPPCPEFGASNDMKNTKHQAAWPAGPRRSGSPESVAGAAGEPPGESEQQVRAILAHAAEGIITITEDGLVETFNPAAEKLFGYTADEMTGQSINILMPGSEATAHDGYIRAYRETGEARIIGIGPREVMGRRKDGADFPIELNVSQYYIGAERRFIGTMRDITKRKETERALRETEEDLKLQLVELRDKEERLEDQGVRLVALAEDMSAMRDELDELNKQKDKFFSIFAHDLKSSFNALLGFSEMLIEEGENLSREKVFEYSTLVHQAGKRAFRLLEDLLDWSRLQMGSVEFEPQPMDIGQAIEASVYLFEPIAAAKSIELTAENGPKLMVLADRQMVDTILRNLVNNAIKFTRGKGTVSLSARASGEHIEIAVTDNGVGIPPENLKRLFLLEEKTSTKGTGGEIGTGLGLHLCKELVKKNGGKIVVESAAGEGSCFRFTLPAAG